MKVSVCVAATRPDTVGDTVRSITAQTHPDWHLVVVAQGPGAGGVAAAVEQALGDHDRARATVVRQDGTGLSRARNAAVMAADGDVIAMIDDDCEADPRWIEVIVDRLVAEPAVGLVGGAVIAPPRQGRGPANCPSCQPADVAYHPGSSPDGPDGPPPGFAWIGANFAFRRATAQGVGEFDELLGAGARFPVAEEIDFMRRAGALGIAMLTTPEAVVHHTYGWRQGVGAVWRLQRNYARGNGAYAAKLTMLGDPRGPRDLSEMRRLTATDWWTRRRPVAVPAGLRRYAHFIAGYRECLRECRVDERGLLVLREDLPSKVAA
jgi:glycosyltransferase involved in cell wall biosynthesis